MTVPDELRDAYEAFWSALIQGRWRLNHSAADAEVQQCLAELRIAAARHDPAVWPQGLATLLWKPPGHHRPSDPPLLNLIHPDD